MSKLSESVDLRATLATMSILSPTRARAGAAPEWLRSEPCLGFHIGSQRTWNGRDKN